MVLVKVNTISLPGKRERLNCFLMEMYALEKNSAHFFPVKVHRANVSSFAGRTLSVAAPRLGHCAVKAPPMCPE